MKRRIFVFKILSEVVSSWLSIRVLRETSLVASVSLTLRIIKILHLISLLVKARSFNFTLKNTKFNSRRMPASSLRLPWGLLAAC
ncbi:hypothetical protein FOVG_19739 [Fusarium oxysporum f. sp. pisi HDV247]|uniref:Uncharacterized protein n=1 Tax=Fusarium oxysporum f. sp. pisi HDV247 TaxID=1080344 RepID=W9ND68_FUSOX|nr:hypothetical protein FOVG_19739 [Fusarium oxysporum f. sp. pisi HDV247]